MKMLRAAFRFLYFVFYTSLKISQISLSNLFHGEDIRRSMRIRRRWAEHLLPRIGIRLHTKGTPPDFPCIIMCNHRSYLDPVILVRYVIGYPVSKAEVAGWPIIGYGAKVSGVFFLQRESVGSRKTTLKGIAEKAREGFPIILFPEGTTQSEPVTGPFKLGAFKLAANESIAGVPVAIDYRSPEDYWVGDDTFLPHFFRRFGERVMEVHVRFGEAIRSDDPQDLLTQSKEWIDSALHDIHKGFKGPF